MNGTDRQKKDIPQIVFSGLAIFASFYHLWTSALGAPPAMLHRSFHLTLMLVLLFLMYSFRGQRPKPIFGISELLAITAVLLVFIFILINYDWFSSRFEFVEPVKPLEILVGVTLIILLIEATRRSTGIILPTITMIFILYGFIGHYLPKGLLWHRGLNLSELVEVSYMGLSGIWSSPIYATSTYVFIFTLFSAFLLKTGAGEFFNDFALSVTKNSKGGAAKCSVVSSGFFGMISGVSTANVVATGSFTIPMMIRNGYSPLYAGAVEAVASTGGQIMPPVMGVAAFIMAEMTGIPYIEIVKCAALPAILYFFSVLMMVHFRAHRKNITMKERIEISIHKLLLDRGYLFIPLVAVLAMILAGFTPQMAGFIGIVVTVASASLKKNTRPDLKRLCTAMIEGARMVVPISAICACAGIIIGIVSMTGLGFRMTQIVITLSGGKLMLALILTMFTSIILGMGLPTSAAYVIMATLLAPAIVNMGVPLIAAHMFVFYFACLSAITPPVALSAYAAAGLAKTSPMKTGFLAWRIGLTAFIVPYFFVYDPALLLIGSTTHIVLAAATGLIGVIGIAASLEGWLFARLHLIARVLLFASGVLLVFPSTYWSGIGLTGFVAIGIINKLAQRGAAGQRT